MLYGWGTAKVLRLPDSQAIGAYMPSCTKEEGLGVCGFRAEEDNSQVEGGASLEQVHMWPVSESSVFLI